MKLNSIRAQLCEWEKAVRATATTRGRATTEDILGVDIRSRKSKKKARAARPVDADYQPSTPPLRKVAGGLIRRKPVNAQARRLFQREPWYHHPPEKPSPSQEKVMSEQVKNEQPANKTKMRVRTISLDGKQYLEESGLNDMVRRAIEEMSGPQSEIADRLRDNRAAIKTVEEDLSADIQSFSETCAIYLKDIRSLKFASVKEIHELMAALTEVRKFFLGRNHEEETKRLTEFVGLCERLQALRDSGFLDKVADVMLKLEVK
jgi:hypothetical protein